MLNIKDSVAQSTGIPVMINTSGTGINKIVAGAMNNNVNDIDSVSYIEKMLVAQGSHPKQSDDFINAQKSDDDLFLESDKDFYLRHKNSPTQRDLDTVMKHTYNMALDSDKVQNVIDSLLKNGWQDEEAPTIAKVLQDPNNHVILSALVRGFFGLMNVNDDHKYISKLNLKTASGSDPMVCLINIQCRTNEQAKKVTKVFKEILSDTHHVYNMDGESTSNEKAESWANRRIMEAKSDGKGCIFLSKGMGFRSWSIKEITHIVHLRDNGDIGQIDQCGSRGSTSGNDIYSQKKTKSHEFFVSLDSNRTDTPFHQIYYSHLVAVSNKFKDDFGMLASQSEDLFFDCIPTHVMSENGKWVNIRSDNADELKRELNSFDNLIQVKAMEFVINFDISSDVFASLLSNAMDKIIKKKSEKNKTNKLFDKAKTRIANNKQPSSTEEEHIAEKEEAELKDLVMQMFIRLLSLTQDIAEHAFEIDRKIPNTCIEACNIIINANEDEEWIEELGVTLNDLIEFIQEKDINGSTYETVFDAVMNQKILNSSLIHKLNANKG